MFERRDILTGGIGLLAFTLGGAPCLLTPAQARAQGAEMRTLSGEEVKILEAFGEALVPGAAAAGMAHYVDQQISGPPQDAMLMLRYLDIAPPFADFYHAALAKLDIAARDAFGKALPLLDPAQAQRLVGAIAKSDFALYFALRADAVDVVYGTRAGMARLGVPVMGHIEPEREW
ncbi:MAG: gluconate 2-dehydrogenase subunit 3 family protein [Pseudomonadota bacterium]